MVLMVPLLAGLIAAAPAEAGEDVPPVCIGVDFVFFDTGSAALTPHAREILDRYRTFLKESHFPSLVELTGATDRVGSKAANLRLSRRRASAVRDYLTARGFPPQRMVIKAAGEDRMLVDTGDGVPEPQNRYVYLFEYLAPQEQARREAIWARVGRPQIVC